MSEFGFSVSRGWDDTGRPDDNWEVFLPHQCDAWQIVDDCPVDHDAAVARMRQFIAEAQEALAALEERREISRW